MYDIDAVLSFLDTNSEDYIKLNSEKNDFLNINKEKSISYNYIVLINNKYFSIKFNDFGKSVNINLLTHDKELNVYLETEYVGEDFIDINDPVKSFKTIIIRMKDYLPSDIKLNRELNDEFREQFL